MALSPHYLVPCLVSPQLDLKLKATPLAEQLDALLPQTQCGQCGYPGCKPYAEAVANGEAINKCAPGGEDTIKKIADLMGVEVQPLDENHETDTTPKVAFIIEEDCIGCTKCIQACPVDAIIGTQNKCTLSLQTSAQVVIYVLHLARSIA